MVKVKICGLQTIADVEAVNRAMPDYAGFIFVPGRRRYIEPGDAERIRRHLSPGIRSVGVFLNAPIEMILSVLEAVNLDVIQLHGEESNVYIRELRKCLSGKFPGAEYLIIKAFRVVEQEDLEPARHSEADLILLDAGAGGGETFDWQLIGDMERPYFLAGGLRPENVRAAIGKLHPYGVDVSSGVETGGRKDPEKIRHFMINAREIL
jgi:phosphoribosylanthranilate isomerase